MDTTSLLSESPGTIALPTSEIGRFAMFTAALHGTMQPPNTNLSIRASASIVENLNDIIRNLRDEDEWLWILGDDHVWKNNALMDMLHTLDSLPEADILVPLVTKRNPPWYLVLFHATDKVFENGVPQWQPYRWDEIPTEGEFEVDASGNAGMLIRRSVLDDLGDPWFENTGGIYLNEDVNFCQKAREHGYRIFATADVFMGHLGIFNVRPAWNGERWGALTEFSSTEEQFKNFFMPTEEQLEALSGK